MSDQTGIEWTDATWNPVTGCTKVSAGCKNCYAKRDWARLSANPTTRYHGRAFGDVQCHADVLELPLRWKRPRRVFVNSMSDVFHPDVPDCFIDRVFAVMALARQHTFQVLTKRADRALDYMLGSRRSAIDAQVDHLMMTGKHGSFGGFHWPLPNVWLGVSVEDQATADERIPLLLQTPAAVRWISAEPLLGPVTLALHGHRMGAPASALRGVIDWVVVGGESGPKARPTHPAWVRDLRDQCAAASVPFLFKQWGEWFPASIGQSGTQLGAWNGSTFMPGWGDIKTADNNMVRAGRKCFGARLLDGVTHDAYPGAEHAGL